MGELSVSDVLAGVAILWGVASTLIVWVFLAGKRGQQLESSGEQVAGKLRTVAAQLRTEIRDAAEKARHDACGKMTPQIGKVEETVDELCDRVTRLEEQAKYADRRLLICERKAGLGNGAGV